MFATANGALPGAPSFWRCHIAVNRSQVKLTGLLADILCQLGREQSDVSYNGTLWYQNLAFQTNICFLVNRVTRVAISS
jgi:hypothetical protein